MGGSTLVGVQPKAGRNASRPPPAVGVRRGEGLTRQWGKTWAPSVAILAQASSFLFGSSARLQRWAKLSPAFSTWWAVLRAQKEADQVRRPWLGHGSAHLFSAETSGTGSTFGSWGRGVLHGARGRGAGPARDRARHQHRRGGHLHGAGRHLHNDGKQHFAEAGAQRSAAARRRQEQRQGRRQGPTSRATPRARPRATPRAMQMASTAHGVVRPPGF